MRTREEINCSYDIALKTGRDTQEFLLEALLDIRDILLDVKQAQKTFAVPIKITTFTGTENVQSYEIIKQIKEILKGAL
jgi:hypothetical protein